MKMLKYVLTDVKIKHDRPDIFVFDKKRKEITLIEIGITKHDRPDIFVFDKKRKEITLIEIGFTNLDLLTNTENEKTRKYDLIANELPLSYKCKVKIIPYVMTWENTTISKQRYRDPTTSTLHPINL